MFLFGNKDGLVRALLARARTDELTLLDRLASDPEGTPAGLVPATRQVWAWLRAPQHRQVLRLWAEAYTRSLVEPEGAWAGFARATVNDWLDVLAACQPPKERDSIGGANRRTLALAALRGCLLDLLATADEARVDGALRHQLHLLSDTGATGWDTNARTTRRV